MKPSLAIALLTFLFISCKQESRTPVNTNKPVDKFFSVKINVIAKKDDTFHVYYTEDGTINFDEKKSVWTGFKGKDSPQDIVFKLPDDAVPTHLRVDFGLNKDQENIVINDFTMSYFGKTFEAKGPDFFTYFYPNPKCTEINAAASMIIPIKKGSSYTGPMFYPQIPLADQIKKLVK